MDIPDKLRKEVQSLEREVAKYEKSLSQLEIKKKDAQMHYDSALSQMGWRKKYFDGWFGGDKSLVEKSLVIPVIP